MNKFFVLLFSVLFLSNAHSAHAWTIKSFDLKGEIQTDGTLFFEERIQADFSDNPFKHGIIREIPTQFEDENGQLFKTPISDVAVINPAGGSHNFVRTKNGANVSLKIGDANQYVNPEETYIIQYKIEGVLYGFEEHDELYWNVTGNEWDAPINQASAEIALPAASSALKAKCFTGTEGATNQDCDYTINEAQTTVKYSSQSPLMPGEGLSVVLGWDKGLVSLPERQAVFDLVGLLKKLQYLFLLFPIWALQRTIRIRNSLKVHKAVIPLYHPPEGLGVGLIGYFDRGKSNTRDLTALITQLCVKGFLKIKEVSSNKPFAKTDYVLTQLKKADASLDKEEQYVLESLPLVIGTEKTLSEMVKTKGSIFSHSVYQKLLYQIRNEVSHYFRASKVSPLKFLGLTFFGFWFFFGAFVFSMLAESFIPIASLVIGTVIALYLPQFNKEGNAIRHDLKGYKKFLTTADKERINWSEAQNIFETNLPYAVALNLTDKWAQVFGDKIQMPEWYEGSSTPDFNQFQKSMTTSAASSIRSSAPRSTSSSRGSSGFSRGGGRSGGGFGGGGGSSW